MLLSELFPGVSLGNGAVEIRGITADSRTVLPGYLFAALQGSHANGVDFIGHALRYGAVAVLAGRDSGIERLTGDVPLISDDNPRRRLALIAARFFGPQPRFIAAVTGTSGKTSVADFTRQIWLANDRRAASLGTLGAVGTTVSEPLSHTTPDPITLHRVLAEIAADGVDHLALEASSHGLNQYRLDGILTTAAAFTNLSRDHYDYHAGSVDYLAAKMRLFTTVLSPGGTAVLNRDHLFDFFEMPCRERGHRIITYGKGSSDLRLVEAVPNAEGQTLSIMAAGKSYRLEFPLPGVFQALNALCAVGLAMASGVSLDQALHFLTTLKAVRGRLEPVAVLANGARIYVDYAHKPAALESVLMVLRPPAGGRLVVVFGCGGDRDRGKRIDMGRIAAAHADRVIVTDDNPRWEKPAVIRRDVLEGCLEAEEISDRGTAIAAAIKELRGGDLLVIAGKGHETSRIVGDDSYPFDDAEVARQAVVALERGES